MDQGVDFTAHSASVSSFASASTALRLVRRKLELIPRQSSSSILMTGTANGHSHHAAENHVLDVDLYGQDTILVHAGLPAHRQEPALLTAISQYTQMPCKLLQKASIAIVFVQINH